MLNITPEFKGKVVEAMLEVRANYGGSDSAFAKSINLHPSVFNRIKNGERDRVLQDSIWLTLGRKFNVTLNSRSWNIARTDVFNAIEEEIRFCKEFSKAKIFVDDCGIGKSYTAKYLSRTLENCFYVDASQAKSKFHFVKLLARTIGVDDKGTHAELKESVKYYLHVLPQPIIIIDEAGDMDYAAFLEIKEFWNATENVCGWYMMGAEGLRAKIESGITHRKVGYREIFSRFSEKYSSIVPLERESRHRFYKKLITDVLSVNMTALDKLNDIVNRCLITRDGNIGGLRRAESLLILNS